MKILVVGGAVRDRLLGRSVHDIDYLVQGGTQVEFLENFPDARLVGNNFPVFLVGGEEYAFARIERSNGVGHKEYTIYSEPGVSIEDDLRRRDLTINAIAECPETSELVVVDNRSLPDIKNKVLRHVNAEAFVEDPLRVFRVARFAAELEGFNVAEETMALMRTMGSTLLTLPGERVFGELRKALSSPQPSRFFEVLKECDCLWQWFPHLYNLIGVPAGPDSGKHVGEIDTFHHTMICIERAPTGDPCLRYTVLCHDFGKALSPDPPKHHGHDFAGVKLVNQMSEELRVPKNWKKSAALFTEQHIRMHKILEMKPGKAVDLILKANKTMHKGLHGFLVCSVGDGMPGFDMAVHVNEMGRGLLSVKLDEEHYGKGRACGEILHQKQCKEWKRLKYERANSKVG